MKTLGLGQSQQAYQCHQGVLQEGNVGVAGVKLRTLLQLAVCAVARQDDNRTGCCTNAAAACVSCSVTALRALCLLGACLRWQGARGFALARSTGQGTSSLLQGIQQHFLLRIGHLRMFGWPADPRTGSAALCCCSCCTGPSRTSLPPRPHKHAQLVKQQQ